MKTKKYVDLCVGGIRTERIQFYSKNAFELIYRAWLYLLAMLFICIFPVEVYAAGIIINEIQYSGGTGKSSHDYIELYNPSDVLVDIGSWQIKKRTSNKEKTGATESSVKEFAKNAVIPARGYYLWANTDADLGGEIADVTSTATIAPNNSIALFDAQKKIVDKVAWGMDLIDPFVEKQPFFVYPGMLERIERKNFVDTNNNAEDFQFAVTASPTASGCLNAQDEKRCSIAPAQDSSQVVISGIYINELYPHVKSGEEEFIELHNDTDAKVNIGGWKLHDTTSTSTAKPYVVPDGETIAAHDYWVVYKNSSGFALNDSGYEKITLLNSNNGEVSFIEYSGTKQGLSYALDGDHWRWTKFLTPGSENVFNNIPVGTMTMDHDVYKNTYANFSIKTKDADDDRVKVTWDFGDGHKSYLAKTRHKYVQTGTYQGSVKMSDGSEDVIKEFTVTVKKYPKYDVDIVAINANPKGKDADFETIILKNNTKKKVDLKGWSVASGTKKLANHPITQKVILHKKEEIQITRLVSKFSLPNKKATIELWYPNGKVASRVEYDHGKTSIAEDEKYIRKDKQWQWQKQLSATSLQLSGENNIQDSVSNMQSTDNQQINEQMNEQKDANEKRAEIELLKNNFAVGNIELNNGKVIGVETVRETEGNYFFNPESREQHYAIVWVKSGMLFLNERINMLLDSLFS